MRVYNGVQSRGRALFPDRILVCSVFVTIFFVIVFLLFADRRGIYVNGVYMNLHDIPHFKEIVEENMYVMPIDSDVHVPEGLFKAVLSDSSYISFDDIVSGRMVMNYSYTYDEKAVMSFLEDYNKDAVSSEDAYIETGNDGRPVIVDEVYGTVVNVDPVMEALGRKEKKIALNDYYIKPVRKASDLKPSIDLFNRYADWKVTYGNSDICIRIPDGGIAIDRQGNVSVDTDFLDGFMQEISDEFTTLGVGSDFLTHSGKTVFVKGGTFGNKVDMAAEKEALMKFLSGIESVWGREPEYSVNMGALGGDYVEVSIPEQHVWLYRDGEAVLDSDCVTGCVSKRRSTPSGLFYIDMQMPGKMLYPSGEKTGSWVNRWMRFTPDGCGLHDATWRSSFGGEIYKTAGSHGCVNLPKDFAYKLYDEVYEGLPVVVWE